MKTTLDLTLDKVLSEYDTFLKEEKKKKWNKIHELFKTLLIESGYPYSIGLRCVCGGYFNIVGFDGNTIDYEASVTMYAKENNYDYALIAIDSFAFDVSDEGVDFPMYMSFDYIGYNKELFEKSLKAPDFNKEK